MAYYRGKYIKWIKHDFNKWEERYDVYNTELKYSTASIDFKQKYITNSRLYFNNIISYSGDRIKSSVTVMACFFWPNRK